MVVCLPADSRRFNSAASGNSTWSTCARVEVDMALRASNVA